MHSLHIGTGGRSFLNIRKTENSQTKSEDDRFPSSRLTPKNDPGKSVAFDSLKCCLSAHTACNSARASEPGSLERAPITCRLSAVDADRVGDSIQVGDVYGPELVARLPEGVDAFGENGEFHSYVEIS